MFKNFKNDFQNIHYNRQDAPLWLKGILAFGEYFYKRVINFKNFLYEKNILKEKQMPIKVICIGNLTTGGVGKTPIVINYANEISKKEPVAIISRGYKAKLNNKKPNVIKDFKNIKFENGNLCGDEPYQIAKKASKNVIVITCSNRIKAVELALIKYGCKTVVLDDGFSNRKIRKDKTIIVIDSKMRFGNKRLLPRGPLREPINEIKRADEIILTDKGDKNILDAISWAKNNFKQKISVCKMEPIGIYNSLTKSKVVHNEKQKAVAFCAIGQSEQFFDFAKQYYDIVKKVPFNDHYKYTKNDIKELIKTAKENGAKIFITTQKDETKLTNLVKNITDFSFNILELNIKIEEIK